MERTGASRLEFTDEHIAELRRLGVIPEQIAKLQDTLSTAQAMIGPSPPLRDIRDRLGELEQKLHAAHSEVERLLTRSLTAAEAEILERLIAVDSNLGRWQGGPPSLRSALQALRRALEVTTRAEAGLPPPGTQERGAEERMGYRPVMWLHWALIEGWKEAHADMLRTAMRLPEPPEHFTPSRNEQSPFFQVIRICYAAIFGRDRSVDRPIKYYITYRKERELSGEAMLEDSLLKLESVRAERP